MGGITAQDERWAYSVDETLQRLPIGRTRLYEAIASGEIKTVRLGRRILIPREAIDDFLRGPPE